jgi:F420H(2)-dependent biliverdin reductase
MKQTLDVDNLPAGALEFLQQFLVALVTTTRPDGTLHVAGVGFVYDPAQKRCYLIGQRDSVKVANIAAGSRAVVAQVEGSRWLSLEGAASLHEDPASVAEAERRYATRYPGHGNPMVGRVAIHIDVERITGIWQRREPNMK